MTSSNGMAEQQTIDERAGGAVEERPMVQGRVGVGMEDARPTVLAGELPCGHLDAQGGVHYRYVIDEMTGVEEDLLAAKGPVLPRLNRIIGNRLVQLGEVTDRTELLAAANGLSTADRMVLLIALRRASLGDNFEVKATCPACSREGHFTVDLAGLAITPMGDRSQRTFDEALPSGRTVRWHVMTPADEEWTGRQRARSVGDDMLTLIMMARIDAVDGVALDRDRGYAAALAAVKGLTVRDRRALRLAFDDREGGVDDEVEFLCPECAHEWRSGLELAQPGFFFPSARPGR